MGARIIGSSHSSKLLKQTIGMDYREASTLGSIGSEFFRFDLEFIYLFWKEWLFLRMCGWCRCCRLEFCLCIRFSWVSRSTKLFSQISLWLAHLPFAGLCSNITLSMKTLGLATLFYHSISQPLPGLFFPL